jgi:patatin-like phospholipase/acyl hydrolase
MPEPKFFRILSIDGGGIRGLIPAQILTVLEAKLKKASGLPDTRLADWFDLIAGTSTGGILTCIYLCPEPNNPERPRFAAPDAVKLYLEHGAKIFDLTLWQKLKSGGGLLDEKYPATGLEKTLQEYLGDLKLSDLVKPCLIPAYDTKNRAAYFFTQPDARQYTSRNFFVRDVARATAAAPTYFECAEIVSDTQVTYTLIDGGVFANNPALCAYAEARKLGSKPTASQMVILSLGTGEVKTPYPYKEIKDWGQVNWARPVIDILMSGTVEVADYQLRRMYEAVGAPEQYLRIQSQLGPENADLGNTEPENLHQLVEIGELAAEHDDEALDQFVALLLAQK